MIPYCHPGPSGDAGLRELLAFRRLEIAYVRLADLPLSDFTAREWHRTKIHECRKRLRMALTTLGELP